MDNDNAADPSVLVAAKNRVATEHGFKLWEAGLFPNVPGALGFANEPPLSEKGEIVFSIRDNGQVWVFALVFPSGDSDEGGGGQEDVPEPIETIVGEEAVPQGLHGTARFWRGDLWGNVPQAINWANQAPIEIKAGQIIFNVRDNGQVWTYTLADWPG